MNIFVLDRDPVKAAQLQCDKHVNKMLLESAQMLSTAHRVLDGVETRVPSKSGKTTVKYWRLPDEREDVLYKAVHVNHPCTQWTMRSSDNYNWHYLHYVALAREFKHRFDKDHRSYVELNWSLSRLPNNIRVGLMTPFAFAMGSNPECINEEDPVASYRAFYQTKQDRFTMKWTKRDVPEWFQLNT